MKTHFVHFQVTLQTPSEEGNLYKEGKVNERTMKEKKPSDPFLLHPDRESQSHAA